MTPRWSCKVNRAKAWLVFQWFTLTCRHEFVAQIEGTRWYWECERCHKEKEITRK